MTRILAQQLLEFVADGADRRGIGVDDASGRVGYKNRLAGLVDGLGEEGLVLQGGHEALVVAQTLYTKAQLVGEIL